MEKKNKVAIIVGLCAAYFICNFTKLSPSAVMPEIQSQMNLSSSITGMISGIYFLSYAIMQFFVGPLCRKFSAPKVIGCAMFVSATGLFLFSAGNSVFLLTLGRFLIGLGTSPCFIGLIFYFQQNYTGEAYVKAYGISLVVSNCGSAAASAPLKAILNVVPRNTVFGVLAITSFVLGCYILVLAVIGKEKGQSCSDVPSIFSQIKQGMVCIVKTPVLMCLLMYWFIESTMLMSYQGLWCIKWTNLAFGSYSFLASFSGIAVSLGLVLSGVFGETLRLYGPFVNGSKSWKRSFFSCGCLCFISIVLITTVKFIPNENIGIVLSLIFDVLFGYSGGLVILHGGVLVKENAPLEQNANIMGINNGFGCLVQQLSQWSTGLGIDGFSTVFALNIAFGCTYYVMALLVLMIVLASRKHLVK